MSSNSQRFNLILSSIILIVLFHQDQQRVCIHEVFIRMHGLRNITTDIAMQFCTILVELYTLNYISIRTIDCWLTDILPYTRPQLHYCEVIRLWCLCMDPGHRPAGNVRATLEAVHFPSVSHGNFQGSKNILTKVMLIQLLYYLVFIQITPFWGKTYLVLQSPSLLLESVTASYSCCPVTANVMVQVWGLGTQNINHPVRLCCTT